MIPSVRTNIIMIIVSYCYPVSTCKFSKSFSSASYWDILHGRRAAKFWLIREIPQNSQKHAKYLEIR